MYNFKEIEAKWQDKWFNEKSFEAVDFHPTKPKYYVFKYVTVSRKSTSAKIRSGRHRSRKMRLLPEYVSQRLRSIVDC